MINALVLAGSAVARVRLRKSAISLGSRPHGSLPSWPIARETVMATTIENGAGICFVADTPDGAIGVDIALLTISVEAVVDNTGVSDLLSGADIIVVVAAGLWWSMSRCVCACRSKKNGRDDVNAWVGLSSKK